MGSLTPKERIYYMDTGKELDRWPIMLFHGTVATRLLGLSYRECQQTAGHLARREIEFYRRFACDNVSIEYGLWALPQTLGTVFNFVEDSAPLIKEYAMSHLDEVDQLNFEDLSFNRDKRQQQVFQAIEKVQEAIGHEVICDFDLMGPFSTAISIIPMQEMMRSLRKSPAKVHQLLQAITDCLLAMIDHFSVLEINYGLTDSVVSNDLIGPKQFDEFAAPYLKQLVDRIHFHGRKVNLHMCGNISPSLESIGHLGLDWLSIDQKMNLMEVKQRIGNQVGLQGNVDPINAFLYGQPPAIQTEIKRVYEQGCDSPKGFCLAPGCSIPLRTPFENIEFFMEEAQKIYLKDK